MEIIARRTTHRKEPLDRHQRHCIHTRPARPPTTQSPLHRRGRQNLTPADVYFGRGQTILLERERIKRDTIRQRRLKHQLKAA